VLKIGHSTSAPGQVFSAMKSLTPTNPAAGLGVETGAIPSGLCTAGKGQDLAALGRVRHDTIQLGKERHDEA
jgi:hypothetical protein